MVIIRRIAGIYLMNEKENGREKEKSLDILESMLLPLKFIVRTNNHL